MKTEQQKRRIIENLFDILCQTDFQNDARKEMTKDLRGKNVSLSADKGTIEIQTHDGTRVQYTIAIS